MHTANIINVSPELRALRPNMIYTASHDAQVSTCSMTAAEAAGSIVLMQLHSAAVTFTYPAAQCALGHMHACHWCLAHAQEKQQ
jgi:hypothetical protein